MADRTPSGWPILSGVCVMPEVAGPLLALLDDGRRRARANGVTLPDGLALVIAALEAHAKAHRGESPLSTSPAVRWIASAEAARRLGVTPQAVSKAAREGRLPSRKEGRRLFVELGAVEVLVRQQPSATVDNCN